MPQDQPPFSETIPATTWAEIEGSFRIDVYTPTAYNICQEWHIVAFEHNLLLLLPIRAPPGCTRRPSLPAVGPASFGGGVLLVPQ